MKPFILALRVVTTSHCTLIWTFTIAKQISSSVSSYDMTGFVLFINTSDEVIKIFTPMVEGEGKGGLGREGWGGGGGEQRQRKVFKIGQAHN